MEYFVCSGTSPPPMLLVWALHGTLHNQFSATGPSSRSTLGFLVAGIHFVQAMMRGDDFLGVPVD